MDDYINPEDLEIFSENWPSSTYKPTTESEVQEIRKTLTKVDDRVYFYNVINVSLINDTYFDRLLNCLMMKFYRFLH